MPTLSPPAGAAKLVLGVDSSTTGCKVIAWNAEGEPVAEGRAAIPLLTPEPGAYEQDGEDIWLALLDAGRRAVQDLGPRADLVESIAITHQRETCLLTDAHGTPLAPALVWMDARCTLDVANAARDLGIDFLHMTTGKVPCTTPSFYKMLGLLRRRPELRELRPYFLDVHGFLARRLVGDFVTSLASADPTGMVAMQQRAYSPELLGYLGVTEAQMARLVEPGQVIGGLRPDVAAALGLRAGLPVVAGAGDGQAAGLGAGVSGSSAYLNLGTAVVCGRLSSRYLIDRGYRTLYGAAPGTFFLEGDLKAGTFLVNWLVGTLLGASPDEQAARIQRLDADAARLPPGSDGLLLLPYWCGVMNPHWDDDATGAILGLRGEHGPAHLFRAIIEGLALETRLHLEKLEQAGAIDELVVMGGGARSDLFCQVVADVTARRVVRSASGEATCLGAGILAATAAKLYPSLDDATRAMTRRSDVFSPGPAGAFYDELYRQAYRPLYPALSATLATLARLRSQPR